MILSKYTGRLKRQILTQTDIEYFREANKLQGPHRAKVYKQSMVGVLHKPVQF